VLSFLVGDHDGSAARLTQCAQTQKAAQGRRHAQAAHAMNGRAVVGALTEKRLRRVIGHRDGNGQSGARTVRRERTGRIAGRRRRQRARAELLGHRHSHGHAARLERAGWIARFIFDPHVRCDVQQRSESLTERYFIAFHQRQHFAIAPQRRLAAGKVAQRQAHGRRVIVDAQRHAARGAHTEQAARIVRLVAGKAADGGEVR
jgi:hypothetical protein